MNISCLYQVMPSFICTKMHAQVRFLWIWLFQKDRIAIRSNIVIDIEFETDLAVSCRSQQYPMKYAVVSCKIVIIITNKAFFFSYFVFFPSRLVGNCLTLSFEASMCIISWGGFASHQIHILLERYQCNHSVSICVKTSCLWLEN
jgi:hypothetical protein